MANEQNLKPFKKGHKSKGGRPKGAISISATIKKLIEKEITSDDPFKDKEKLTKSAREHIALRLIANAIKGDVKAAREVLDRLEGKAVQKTEISGIDGAPIKSINVTMTEQEAAQAYLDNLK